jgi:ABC-type Zn uptake system ZnuABC Zn-binding protein ZnuA
MKFATILLLVLSAATLRAGEKLEVASLNTVLTDVAKNVGGDKVAIDGIIKPDVDPHEFTPSTQDVRAIAKARVVLLSGNGMEAAYLAKLEKSVGPGPVFVPIGKSIKPILVETEEDEPHDKPDASGKIPDPHWWHSIKNVETATRAVRDAFIQADPANASVYEANTKAYEKQLAELDRWARLEIARLPRDKRILVTSHDAFGYFARDYGFIVYPIEGISTEDQPSSNKVRKIIDAIKKERVKAIFLENIENPKVLTEITRETGAKTGGVLYADGLGKGADTYEEMIRHNYSTIVSGLE